MKKIVLDMKVLWFILIVVYFLAFAQFLYFPESLNSPKIIFLQGEVEDVECHKGRRDWSPKVVTLSGSNLGKFTYRERGNCEEISNELKNSFVKAYGYFSFYLEALDILELYSDSERRVSFKTTKKDEYIYILLFYILIPLLIVGAQTYHSRKASKP